MALGDWLMQLSDLLKHYNITTNMLLLFTAVVFVAFVLSLREFMSWLTKTASLRRDLDALKVSMSIIEHKIDTVLSLQLKENDSAATEEGLVSKRPLKTGKADRKQFDISH